MGRQRGAALAASRGAASCVLQTVQGRRKPPMGWRGGEALVHGCRRSCGAGRGSRGVCQEDRWLRGMAVLRPPFTWGTCGHHVCGSGLARDGCLGRGRRCIAGKLAPTAAVLITMMLEYRSTAPVNRALADGMMGSIGFGHPAPGLERRVNRPRPSGFAGSWAAPPSRPAQAAFPESRCAPRCRPGCAAAGRARRSRARFRSGRCRP